MLEPSDSASQLPAPAIHHTPPGESASLILGTTADGGVSDHPFAKAKQIAISGVGFFSDAYDLFIINIVMAILAEIPSVGLQDAGKTAISTAALVGAILGQLTFGYVGDKLGRKKAFVATLTLVIVGAVLSSLAFHFHFLTLIVTLATFRFVLGVGIGGEYPLSATITAESAGTANRGRMIAAVFSMQGVGSFAAAFVGFALLRISTNLEFDWRMCLGIGAVPGVLSMYFRITMHETASFQRSAQTKPAEKQSLMWLLRGYWKRLLGTAGGWFILDVVFYANGLFSNLLTSALIIKSDDPIKNLRETSLLTLLLSLWALPGYWLAIYLIETPPFGRRNTQLFGFVSLTVVYSALGLLITFTKVSEHPALFQVLYGLTFFLCNAGANTTTYVLPSEVFPTRVRATFHGISAAAGKLGAVVGAASMAYLVDKPHVVFYLCAGVAISGAILTFFCVEETMGKSLSDLNDEGADYAPASLADTDA